MRGMKDEVKVSARTEQKALKEAANILGIAEEEVDYRLVSQTKGGFLSFLGKKVEILARRKNVFSSGSKRLPNRRSGLSRPQKEVTEVLSNEDSDALVEDLRLFCAGICERMLQEEVAVSAVLQKDRLVLNIDSDELAKIVAKNTKIPEALEHILRKKPRHLKRELPFRIFVDVSGYRQARENELIDLAKDLSEKVSENKRPIVLNYKSSYDRKIIHMALDKDERVYTRSIGSGTNRKLMILPIKKKGAELEDV